MEALAVHGRVCSTAAGAAPGLVQSVLPMDVYVSVLQQSVPFPEVSGLDQRVIHMDVTVHQQPVLHQLHRFLVCLPRRACATMNLAMSGYKSFCVHLGVCLVKEPALHLGCWPFKLTHFGSFA
jgi:hypothetical protein